GARRRRVAHEIVEPRPDVARDLAQPEARRQQLIQELEAAAGVEARAIGWCQLLYPARRELRDRHRDSENAPGVQTLHELQVALAEPSGCQPGLFVHQAREVDVCERALEGLETGVLGELEAPRLDQAPVRIRARREVAGVLADDGLGQHFGDAELI